MYLTSHCSLVAVVEYFSAERLKRRAHQSAWYSSSFGEYYEEIAKHRKTLVLNYKPQVKLCLKLPIFINLTQNWQHQLTDLRSVIIFILALYRTLILTKFFFKKNLIFDLSKKFFVIWWLVLVKICTCNVIVIYSNVKLCIYTSFLTCGNWFPPFVFCN